MRPVICIAICSAFCIAVTSANASSADNFKKARTIINQKCTTCHSKDKIDLALSSGKNMNSIQSDMEKRGARLNANEREVLGIFWRQAKPVTSK